MTPKEIVEIIVVLGGLGLTIFGAVYSALSGTTTVRRAKLTGDLMEQTVKVQRGENDALQKRVDNAEAALRTIEEKCDELRDKVDKMSVQKELDTKALEALTALAKSLGATPAQLKLAAAGIVVTKAELDADPALAQAIDKVVSHADKLTGTVKISEGQ